MSSLSQFLRRRSIAYSSKKQNRTFTMLFYTAAIFLLLEAGTAVGAGVLHQDGGEKKRNLRPPSEGSSQNKEEGDSIERLLQDKEIPQEPIDGLMCEDRDVDLIQDPISNPQFKNLDVPVLEIDENGFCVDFNNVSDTEGFAPCPRYWDNIATTIYDVGNNPWNDDEINPLTGSTYLHIRDRSRASLACGTGSEYTGDWTKIKDKKCFNLCYDVNLFYDGCTNSNTQCEHFGPTNDRFKKIYPTIILQGGPTSYYRAAFRANEYMTDSKGDNPGWRRVCAPLGPLDAEGNLPSNDDGQWYMAAPNDILSGNPGVPGPASPASAWNDLLSDITAIQVPVDYTSNPAERIGIDHICIEEGDCTDSCKPEPSCFWKHEWQCENAKKEEWYGNFTQLVDTSIDTFNSKHLCICDVLNDCCPDLCAIAEQELLALLLNVASGQVALGCGVVECNDCFYNVSEVIEIVDDLLSHASRSDYECSKALQYLTGINQDEILCDSPGDDGDDCEQTERCTSNNGVCVKKQDCSSAAGDDCIDGWCEGTDCTCKLPEKTSTPSSSPVDSSSRPTSSPSASPFTKQPVFYECPQTERCARNGGECVRDCVSSPGVDCDPDLCDGIDCFCRKQSQQCLQTRQCAARKGDCVNRADCIPSSNVDCIDDLCFLSRDCTCKVEGDKPECKQTDNCEKRLGKCTRDCKAIPGVTQCSDDCDSADGCKCKNCIQNHPECLRQGGTCMLQEVCKEQAGSDPERCNVDLCKDPFSDEPSDCACFLPSPRCPLSEECRKANGACIPATRCEKFLADSADTLQCTNTCSEKPEDPDCLCLQCNTSLRCEAVQGTCVPFCVAQPGEVCDQNLCAGTGINGPCACKYKRDIAVVIDEPQAPNKNQNQNRKIDLPNVP